MHRIQFIHEDDLTDVIILSIKQDVKGAFNVASNIIPDVREFYEREYGIKTVPSSRLIGSILIKFSKIIPKLGWLQAMRYMSYMDTEKVQKTFNWTPKYTTEQCIKEMIEL
jgi:nucleoside-diphosphate-sugar epimerase